MASHGRTKTYEYSVWHDMKSRCNNPNVPCYPDYGGRGIRVCPQWMVSFECFLKDMGEKPTTASVIDRIDCDGDYSPENCRWVNTRQSANNKRTSKKLTYLGETKTVAEWSYDLEINYQTLHSRIRRGWDVSVALGYGGALCN